jgi:hypothetical protein
MTPLLLIRCTMPTATALSLNLDPSVYGTLAEIGAGQEVARWFLAVGGASGKLAKTISASDKTVSRPQIKSLQPLYSLTCDGGFESHMGLRPTHGHKSASLRFIDPNWVIRRLSTEGWRRRFQHPFSIRLSNSGEGDTIRN